MNGKLDNPERRKVQDWARGLLIHGKRRYHPYTYKEEFKEEAIKNNYPV